MEIGTGLPTTVPGTPPTVVPEWARRAEAAGFASLGALDRMVYDSTDPLIALAAAAAVTERIPLVTSILTAPLRETASLAKQLVALQGLAPGRLVLGVAIGARGDDYDRSELPRSDRGRRLSGQLVRLRELLDEGAMGPSAGVAGRPTVLVGGSSGPAYARAARHADGWFHGGSPPRAFARAAGEVHAAWEDAGRPGRPQIWSMAYVALGDPEAGRRYLLDYYAFTGAYAPRIADGLLTTRSAVRAHVEAFRDAGCDHLLLFPTTGDLDEIERLADALA